MDVYELIKIYLLKIWLSLGQYTSHETTPYNGLITTCNTTCKSAHFGFR